MAQDREQEQTGCRQTEAPLLCVNKCGFFGCPTTMNLCSKCYKDLLLKEEGNQILNDKHSILLSALSDKILAKTVTQSDLASASSSFLEKEGMEIPLVEAVTSAEVAVDISTPAPSQPLTVVVPSSNAPVVAGSTGPSRCHSCRKRVGLLGFKCRCGGVFCSSHRYSDMHDCTFDYKAAGRDAIAKENPLVKAEKVEKI